jgi:hypothetical protein
VEERRSWLPAGLESSRWEPDDRSSQRSDRRGKGRGEGPTAAADQPYDEGRPESKAGRWRREPDEAAEPIESKEPAEAEAEGSDSGDDAEGDRAKGRPRGRRGGRRPGAGRREEKAEDRREQRQEQRGRSDVDALGQDKHRQVVGQRYGLSRARQLLFYGICVAFLIAAFIGLRAAADQLDKAPAHDPDKAPWSRPSAPQGPLGGFEPRKPGQKGPTHFQ